MIVAAPLALAQPQPPPPLFIPPATLDDTLEVNGESVEAKRLATRMVVGVMVAGQGPFRFVVDSGADRSVIGAALAARLGLPPGPPVIVQGMAGASKEATVKVASLRIGASEIADLVAPALPERFIGAQGLVGIDALAGQRLMLDFEKQAITVQDGHRPVPTYSSDEIVVTARRRKGQLILTRIGVGRDIVSAVIDTGSQMTIGNSALLARVWRRRTPPPVRPVMLISVTGQPIMANLVVLPEVRIGTLMLKQVPVAFVDAPPFALFGLARQPAMLLGTDVLQSFRRVSLDFHYRKVRFTLRR